MIADTPMAADPIQDEIRRIGSRWGHFLALGIVLIILGTLAIANAFLATLTITVACGILLAACGLVQIASAIWAGQWRGFLVQLLLGIFYLVAGTIVFRHPLEAAMGFTLVLAIFYMAGGLMRIAFAITHRAVGTNWVLLNGLITLILGLFIWWQWPADVLWVLGLFVGIDMLFLGWSWVMLGMAVRPGRTWAAPNMPAPGPQGPPA